MKTILLKAWEARAAAEGRLLMLARPGRGKVEYVFDDEPNEMKAFVGGKAVSGPFGAPGDVLLCKETWFEQYDTDTARPYDPPRACYQATEKNDVSFMDGDGFTVYNKNGWAKSPWRSSTQMPEWAVRFRPIVEAVTCKRVIDLERSEFFDLGLSEDGDRGDCTLAPYMAVWRTQWAKDNPRHPWPDSWVWLATLRWEGR